jgi:hypothetical protein
VKFPSYTGNIESQEAEAMTRHLEDVLFKCSKPLCQPLFPSQHLTNRVPKLESGINYFYTSQCLNPDDENSALVHYIQVNLLVCNIYLMFIFINVCLAAHTEFY